MKTHLVWFRHDLRSHDNYALHAACRDSGARVIALYIATPRQWQQHSMAPRQAWFIQQHVQDLQKTLAEKQIVLTVLQCDDFDASVDMLSRYCQQEHVDHLYYNYQYEVNERQRDAQAEKILEQQGVTVQGFDDSVLSPPGSVLTGNREMYKVFTPFSKALTKRLQEQLPEMVKAPAVRNRAAEHQAGAFEDFDYPLQEVNEELFPVGEAAALQRLRHFCHDGVADYKQHRDIPAIDGTSLLSAYLAIGVLSPRQCLYQVLDNYPDALVDSPAFVWINELFWREFYRHLLVAWPDLCRHQPFVSWTRNVKWRVNAAGFDTWKAGKTGFPIVDAAMRQLNHSGWMHNRLRMIVASFLVKDLLVDWREGEQYFISQLVDGDLAANNGGWQWAASTGTDAAPYFRIFNPTTQGERFDPKGEFIKKWLPELKEVPDEAIHQPQRWADKQGKKLDYPDEIVEHKLARKEALSAYDAAKK
ncbi:MAG: Deoxyribodipyrimidine photo-lyase [Candidatus Erwinia impunctatus]|nr:Deoxyribodipyrimidine photo-lyase [Culicoides impunctatus]